MNTSRCCLDCTLLSKANVHKCLFPERVPAHSLIKGAMTPWDTTFLTLRVSLFHTIKLKCSYKLAITVEQSLGFASGSLVAAQNQDLVSGVGRCLGVDPALLDNHSPLWRTDSCCSSLSHPSWVMDSGHVGGSSQTFTVTCHTDHFREGLRILLTSVSCCVSPVSPSLTGMDLNWPFLLSMAVFYLAVLGVGLWASKKARREEKKCTGNISEVTVVGGRNLNLFISIFTMTATWVGGGYIMGCAEVTYNPRKGLVWAIMPVAFAANMILGEWGPNQP